MRRTLAIVSLPLLAVLAGCPDGHDSCAPENEKAVVVDLFRSWYLYQDLLPAQIDTAAYDTTAELVYALTADARAAGMDRYWSYVTTASQAQAFFDEGTSVGFGIGLLVRADPDPQLPDHLFVSQVFPGSAADDAGFLRGDEILAIGETADTLVAVPALLGALGAAFGPSTAGVTRVFEVQTLAPATEVRTVTKRTYGLDPVPAWTVIDRTAAGLPPAGYVSLRTFIGPADDLLSEAFAQLAAAGVGDVVVDLRYNGGGYISTAQVLANLLGGGLAGDVMFELQNNALHSDSDATALFAPPVSNPFGRIAFITTEDSASASELVPNVLEAWKHADVALVGARTYGKPVGQRGFVIRGCDTLVYLVSLRLVNAEGDGAYYDGLPDVPASGLPAFSGQLCPADDDLTQPPGDPAEASTDAALQWLATGICPTPVAKATKPTSAAKAGPAPDAHPEAPDPDLAQRHVRGLF